MQCMGCDTFAFLDIYEDEDMFEVTGPDYHTDRLYYKEYRVYPKEPMKENPFGPPQLSDYDEKFEFANLPDLISEIRNEAIYAYRQRMNLLCNTGIRMLIETICKVKGIDDKGQRIKNGKPIFDKNNEPVMVPISLEEKIKKLKEKEIINDTLQRIFLEIKDIGNQTVHQFFKPKRSDLLQYLETIDSILYSIFELPHIKFEKHTSSN
ncbi:hypothetical protein EF87_21335 [Bacillus amyloliquefaciens]|nr:hypothetical protein EF87_21335 [Bacillus amyloliquefaciens]